MWSEAGLKSSRAASVATPAISTVVFALLVWALITASILEQEWESKPTVSCFGVFCCQIAFQIPCTPLSFLPSFLEASFQPHLLPCPTNCVDSHTQIQFMVFLTQALLLLLPLFYFLNFFVTSFLGRYISRSFVHHLITLQEEVWAVGLWVLLELVCFL